MSTWTHHRAKVASLSRVRSADDPDLVEARRDLKASRLEATAREAAESLPPLTDEQARRIAAIICPQGGDR